MTLSQQFLLKQEKDISNLAKLYILSESCIEAKCRFHGLRRARFLREFPFPDFKVLKVVILQKYYISCLHIIFLGKLLRTALKKDWQNDKRMKMKQLVSSKWSRFEQTNDCLNSWMTSKIRHGDKNSWKKAVWGAGISSEKGKESLSLFFFAKIKLQCKLWRKKNGTVSWHPRKKIFSHEPFIIGRDS